MPCRGRHRQSGRQAVRQATISRTGRCPAAASTAGVRRAARSRHVLGGTSTRGTRGECTPPGSRPSPRRGRRHVRCGVFARPASRERSWERRPGRGREPPPVRGSGPLPLPPRSPERNGRVERNDAARRYEFYAARQLPTDSLGDADRCFAAFRPGRALAGFVPARCLAHTLAPLARKLHRTDNRSGTTGRPLCCKTGRIYLLPTPTRSPGRCS